MEREIKNMYWLTVKQCCDVKGLYYPTMRHRKEWLPPLKKVGGKWCASTSDVERWVTMSDDECIEEWHR